MIVFNNYTIIALIFKEKHYQTQFQITFYYVQTTVDIITSILGCWQREEQCDPFKNWLIENISKPFIISI